MTNLNIYLISSIVIKMGKFHMKTFKTQLEMKSIQWNIYISDKMLEEYLSLFHARKKIVGKFQVGSLTFVWCIRKCLEIKD